MKQATVQVRTQKSRGNTSKRFGGPDKYFAVVVHNGNFVDGTPLRADSARRRGWVIKYFGEGYSRHSGPRSMYHANLCAANEFARQFNLAYAVRAYAYGEQ